MVRVNGPLRGGQPVSFLVGAGFIDQPLATLARVASFHLISCWASAGALSSPFYTAGSSLAMSKLLPGSMPMRFICAMIGSSMMCGGCSLSSSAA